MRRKTTVMTLTRIGIVKFFVFAKLSIASFHSMYKKKASISMLERHPVQRIKFIPDNPHNAIEQTNPKGFFVGEILKKKKKDDNNQKGKKGQPSAKTSRRRKKRLEWVEASNRRSGFVFGVG